MKANIFRLISAFFLVGGALLSAPAFAQREGLSPADSPEPSHLEYTNNDEKAAPEHDAKLKSITRDSIGSHNRSAAGVSAARTKSTEKGVNGKEEDDDALSFNFLYYIIQRFKISDLVDEQ